MKRVLFLFLAVLLLLAGCGDSDSDSNKDDSDSNENKFGLNEKKVEKVISERALNQAVFENKDYKKNDIKVYKICKTAEKGKENLGFQGVYRVYWKTSDGEYNDEFILEDYKAKYGNANYSDLKNSCIK